MRLQTTSITCFNSTFEHYYLCHYLSLSAGEDILSHSLLRFKDRRQPDLDVWIDSSLAALKEAPLSADAIILRALHHDETIIDTANETALDILGQNIAGRFGCRYLP